jgi:hypothetical protein
VQPAGHVRCIEHRADLEREHFRGVRPACQAGQFGLSFTHCAGQECQPFLINPREKFTGGVILCRGVRPDCTEKASACKDTAF